MEQMTHGAPQTVSQYRREKFNSYFKFLDANQDGSIAADDFDIAARNMAGLSNASAEETDALKEALNGWWEMYRNGKKDVTEVPVPDAAQSIVTYVSTADPATAMKYTRLTHEKTFDLIDRNKGGVISPDELIIYYKSYGVHDEDVIESIFQKLDVDDDGLISREEFVEAHVAFWYSDDPENGCHFLYDVPKENTTFDTQ